MNARYRESLFIRSISMVVTLAVISWAGGCGKQETAAPDAAAIPVLATEAVVMDIPMEIKTIGRVEAYNTVSMTARVGGQLVKVGFEEGENVNKGDLLFQIDPRPYESALSQAQANLERDQTRLEKAETDVARYKELVQKDYVTKQDYDQVVATAAEAKATVKADSAIVQNARLNLEYCTISAPISGRTGNLNVKLGNLITANSSNPLVTLNQIAPIYAAFTIPEQYLSEVRLRSRDEQLSVWAVVPTDSTRIFEGLLTFIDNTVNTNTGTIMLKATFPNKDHALWPGQYVRIGLVLGKHLNATVIPLTAVQSSQDRNYVYVIAPGDTVQMRPVEEGPVFQDKIVITKGVSAGERVVTDGQLMLRPGSKIMLRSGLELDAQGGGQQ